MEPMSRKDKFLLRHVAIALLAVTTVGCFLYVGLFNGKKTGDDLIILPKLLENQSSQQILGASSDDDSYLQNCPELKPIIGWIDFSGKKVIRQNLPQNQKPSACFESIQQAKDNGFTNEVEDSSKPSSEEDITK